MPLKRRGKSKKISPFPSSKTYMRRNYTHSSEIYSTGGTKKRRHFCRRHGRIIHKRKRYFAESPMRRDLRIKHSIEHSIRSHIDRLSDYRYNSMMKCDMPPIIQVPGHPYYVMAVCKIKVDLFSYR